MSVLLAHPKRGRIASDGFQRVGALGAGWSNWTTFAGNTVGGNINVNNGKALSASGSRGATRTEAFHGSQYAEISIQSASLAAGDGAAVGLNTPADGSVGGYTLLYFNNGGTYQFLIAPYGGSADTTINLPGPLPVGTKLRLQRDDQLGYYSAFRDGKLLGISPFMSGAKTGAPSIYVTGSTAALGNFVCGNVDVARPMIERWFTNPATGAEWHRINHPTNAPSDVSSHHLRILKPTSPAALPHRLLLCWHVDTELSAAYGNPETYLNTQAVANTLNATIVIPAFGSLGWLSDHPTDPGHQYETWAIKQLLPWMRANLGNGSEKVDLLSFSKGAMASLYLLFQYPTLFNNCAVWDFPASTMTSIGQYGAGTADFGDQTTLNKYLITDAFVTARKAPFQSVNRIWMGGYNAFQTDVNAFDTLCTAQGIQHTKGTMANITHAWDSGWVPEAVTWLAAR